MKKVLMISYFYPPLGGVGIIRTLKFSNYLPKFGWMPYVLTVKNRDRFYTNIGNDRIPAHVKVYKSWNLFNNLSIFEGGLRRVGVNSQILVPDAYIGWIPLAIKKAEKIIKEEDIDLIYVSCPPHSQSLIGAKLRSITGVPLVVDFRDAWTLNPYSTNYLLKSLKNLNERLERYVLESADYVVTATEGIKSDYVSKYRFVKSKIMTILNGFDLDDIPKDVIPLDKFTIVYTGFFYGVQSPELFFAALEKILKNDLIPKDEFQFIWAGRNAPFVHKLAREYNIEDIVNYIGLVSKKEAEELLYKSHLLFLLIGSTDEVSQNTTLTGKIFPYLASGKPILALIPNGTAKELIGKYSDNSYIISSGNTDVVVDAIVEAYNKWKDGETEGKTNSKTEEFRRQFNHETLTKRLLEVFEKVGEK